MVSTKSRKWMVLEKLNCRDMSNRIEGMIANVPNLAREMRDGLYKGRDSNMFSEGTSTGDSEHMQPSTVGPGLHDKPQNTRNPVL
jgi:predicted phage tail protein